MSNLHDLQQRALRVRQLYNQLNERDGHAIWGGKELTMGLVGDVGELMEFVMAKERLRRGEDIDAKLAHELADCLWSVMTIAQYYDVDLEQAFTKTMDELEQRVTEAMQ